MTVTRRPWWLLAALALGCGGGTWTAPPDLVGPIPPVAPDQAADAELDAFFAEGDVATDPSVLARLHREAEAVAELVQTPWVRQWLDGVKVLPEVRKRAIYRRADKSDWFTEAQRDAMRPDERAALVAEPVDTERYYYTKYGSPLAYARPLELAGRAGMPSPAKGRVLDFGYGTVGHLRLLSVMGVQAFGVDVDPFLRALYGAPADQGPFPPSSSGRVSLLHGRFPADPEVAQGIGAGLSLVLSKNVLKRGYIHPEQPVPKKQTIDLGVDDAGFVAAVHERLQPGGYFMIYNITPPPNGPGQPYRTWADGRCPFARGLMEKAGFTVLAYDVDDSEAARRQGRALGWDADIDLETQIFATYTLAQKR